MNIKIKSHGCRLKWFRYSEKLGSDISKNRGYINNKGMLGLH